MTHKKYMDDIQETMSIVFKNIKDRREALNMSLRDLSARSCGNPFTLPKAANNNTPISLSTLTRTSKVLGCQPWELLKP